MSCLEVRLHTLLLSKYKLFSIYLKGLTSEAEDNLSTEEKYAYLYFPGDCVVSTHDRIQTAMIVIISTNVIPVKKRNDTNIDHNIQRKIASVEDGKDVLYMTGCFA